MRALYFPDLSLPPLAWTHPMVLYFDQLGIIAPTAYEPGLTQPKTARLVEVGLVQPMAAGIHDRNEEEDAHFVERTLRRQKSAQRRRGASFKLYAIHVSKLTYTGLVDDLVRSGVLHRRPDDDRWLIGPEDVCLQIMTLLAQRIVRAGSADFIATDQTPAFRMSTGLAGAWQQYDDRRVDAVTRLLPVAPWAMPEQLARFKSDHPSELRLFRDFVEQLIRRDDDEDQDDFYSRLKDAERLRDHLCGELDAINARAGGPGLALAIANFVAPLLEASFLSAGASGLSSMHSRSYDARRRAAIEADGLVYAAKASRKMRASSSRQLLA